VKLRLACLALLLGSGPLRGQGIGQADLDKWLAEWQGRMRLQDWLISISLAHRVNMPRDAVGNVRMVLSVKVAAIKILDATEIQNVAAERLRRYSELTVVHELVHVAVAPVVPRAGDDDEKNRENERVEDIAEALLFGRVPACATARDFMEAEIASLPFQRVDARIREEVIGKLTAAFLAGRPSWTAQHTAVCASAIKSFFARSGWR